MSSVFLLISSELILSDQQQSSSKPPVAFITRIKYIAIVIAIIAATLLVSHDVGYVLLSYTSFLALALYTGKFNQAFPKTNQWIIIALYIYAGLSLHILVSMYSPEALVVTVIISLYAPLKVLLYYTGYRVLLRSEAGLDNIFNVTQETKGKIQKEVKFKRIPQPLPPEPTIQIQLNGIWGFFYILWRYPSGKIVLLFILASLVTATAFLVSNINTLIALLRK